jgi:hypothetical protein
VGRRDATVGLGKLEVVFDDEIERSNDQASLFRDQRSESKSASLLV